MKFYLFFTPAVKTTLKWYAKIWVSVPMYGDPSTKIQSPYKNISTVVHLLCLKNCVFSIVLRPAFHQLLYNSQIEIDIHISNTVNVWHLAVPNMIKWNIFLSVQWTVFTVDYTQGNNQPTHVHKLTNQCVILFVHLALCVSKSLVVCCCACFNLTARINIYVNMCSTIPFLYYSFGFGKRSLNSSRKNI